MGEKKTRGEKAMQAGTELLSLSRCKFGGIAGTKHACSRHGAGKGASYGFDALSLPSFVHCAPARVSATSRHSKHPIGVSCESDPNLLPHSTPHSGAVGLFGSMSKIERSVIGEVEYPVKYTYLSPPKIFH